MGNKTGHGACFRKAIAAVRAVDPSRPIHWERGNRDADVDSEMYPSVAWLDRRSDLGDVKEGLDNAYHEAMWKVGRRGLDHTAGKCFFLCEYAHAMGNAIGDLADYWDVFYRHPSLSSGCIWDRIDHAVWKPTGRVDPKMGREERMPAFGGDWDEQPNDGPFNCNGVIDPLRRVTAKLVEVGHVYRNIKVEGGRWKVEGGTWTIENRHNFRTTEGFAGHWCLKADGIEVASGTFTPPVIAPLAHGAFAVPELGKAIAGYSANAELAVDFAFVLTKDERWAEKGWIVAHDQISVRPVSVTLPPLARNGFKVSEKGDSIICTAGGSRDGRAARAAGVVPRMPGVKTMNLAGKWVHAPAFKDQYLSERLRLQLWMLRIE